jgi:hypothetical protein
MRKPLHAGEGTSESEDEQCAEDALYAGDGTSESESERGRERARERERESVCVCVCARASEKERVRQRERVCERATYCRRHVLRPRRRQLAAANGCHGFQSLFLKHELPVRGKENTFRFQI